LSHDVVWRLVAKFAPEAVKLGRSGVFTALRRLHYHIGVHPRNVQAFARHSTIDLTMNVYTHVAMEDLATDVENLPSILGGPQKKAESAVPSDLVGILGNWGSLPEHVRMAIATVAGW